MHCLFVFMWHYILCDTANQEEDPEYYYCYTDDDICCCHNDCKTNTGTCECYETLTCENLLALYGTVCAIGAGMYAWYKMCMIDDAIDE